MVVSLTHPHDPFTITEPYWGRYSDAEIDPPRVERRGGPHGPALAPAAAGLRDRPAAGDGRSRSVPRDGPITAPSHTSTTRSARVARDPGARPVWPEDTCTIVLADHGEMLGERGLWYKMSFFEPACRVPLIVHAPGRFAAAAGPAIGVPGGRPADPGRARVGLALRRAFATPLDGRSLLPHLEARPGHDEVFGEYLGEGALAPIVMIRRGRHKFIRSPGDPDQLYDLENDLDELHNLAAEASGPLLAEFGAEAERRWSLPALHAEVLASQRRRRMVAEALRLGVATAWDYQPVRDAREQYIRSHTKLEDLEAMARLPRPVPP